MKSLGAADPREIGPYTLLGVLGGGGMGRVYLGRAADGSVAAVKAARPELADDPQFRRRFTREVATARQVAGTFVAPVVAAEPDGEQPWMATAYVPGISLTDAVGEYGPLPEPAVRLLTAGLARALAAIHARELVHRDLKPSNVLLAADGPRVIDFGIAHSASYSALTHTGMALGTPGFMAPEQVSSAGPGVTGATDVFALGGVVTYALSGRGPYGSGDPHVLMYRTVHEEPRTAHLPPGLRELAERCLDQEPARRPTLAQVEAESGPAGPYAGWLPEPVAQGLLALAERIERAGGPAMPVLPADTAVQPVSQQITVVPDGPVASGPASPAGLPVPDGPADVSAEAVTVRPAPLAPPPFPPTSPAPATPSPMSPPLVSAPAAPQHRPGVTRRNLLIGLSAAGAATAGGLTWALWPDGPGGANASGDGRGSDGDPAQGENASGSGNPLGVTKGAPLSVVLFEGPASGDYLAKAAARYRDAFGDAPVKTQRVLKVGSMLQAALTKGNPPDLVNNSGADALDVYKLAKKGELADLAPLLDAPSLDDPRRTVRETLRTGTAEAGRLGGTGVHLLPYGQTVYGLWYQPAVLKEKGWQYPRDWQQMLELCAAAKRRGIAGWTFAGKYPVYLTFAVLPAIAQAGGREVLKAIDDLEGGAWRHEAVREVFEAYYELGAKGYVLDGSQDLDHFQSQSKWADGDALFLPNGSWLQNELRNDEVEPAVGAGPSLSSSDELPYGTLWAAPGDMFLVPKDAGNPKGGMEMLRTMLSRESAREYTRTTGSLSSLSGAEKTADLPSGAASARRAFDAAGRNLVNPRLSEWYPDLVTKQIGPALAELVLGDLRPSDAVTRVQRAADAAARDGSVPKRRHPAG